MSAWQVVSLSAAAIALILSALAIRWAIEARRIMRKLARRSNS